MSAKVAVIGAGVVGLSVAIKLKEEFGSAVDVTIIAETFFQGTTSFGSGGFWEPYAIAGKKCLSFGIYQSIDLQFWVV
jgi:glycine/D-amino acid oxidase-like deaminating enzyme